MAEIRPINGELVDVRLEDLSVQYFPVLTSDEIWRGDMSLANSPHVELARLLLEHGCNWEAIESSRFVADRRHRFAVGETKWTENFIQEHIFESRYRTLSSLQQRGFQPDMCEGQPVSIIDPPLWATRFGLDLSGMEIQRGHRRCAAAYALGWTHIPALMCEDAREPGDRGKFEKKFRDIEGIWTAAGMPAVFSKADVTSCLRSILETQGYHLDTTDASDPSGADLLASRDGVQVFVEVMAHRDKGSARAKEFCQAFFHAISRLEAGATRLAIALPDPGRGELPVVAGQYGEAWERLGRAFPELQIWLVDMQARTLQCRAWNDWASA